MTKKILTIDAHPDPSPDRLCHALAQAYGDGAEAAGHDVRRLEVGRLEFPVLRSQAEFEQGPVAVDIEAAQSDLLWAEHVVLVYPLWLGTMPALLKAFLEQTFRAGFAFEKTDTGWGRARLKGRSVRVVVTMGMPALAYRWFYLSHSLRSLERNILKFCGLGPVRETLFGMVDTASEARRRSWLAKMRALGRKAA